MRANNYFSKFEEAYSHWLIYFTRLELIRSYRLKQNES